MAELDTPRAPPNTAKVVGVYGSIARNGASETASRSFVYLTPEWR